MMTLSDVGVELKRASQHQKHAMSLRNDDSRSALWVGYFSALIDAIGLNNNRLTLMQRVVFVVWPASWLLLLGAHARARSGDWVGPFANLFSSPPLVGGVGLGWLVFSIWLFKDRLNTVSQSVAVGVRFRYLFYFLVTIAVAVLASQSETFKR